MRVVSQDGMIDVPYEISAFSFGHKANISEFNIYIRSKFLDEKPCIIATYSTQEKAMKAMEMLRSAYSGMPVIFQNVEPSDVERMLKRAKTNGIIAITDDKKSKIEYVNNVIFRFPKDEEVEG